MDEPRARIEAEAEEPDLPRRGLERHRVVVRHGDVEGGAIEVLGAGRAADGAVVFRAAIGRADDQRLAQPVTQRLQLVEGGLPVRLLGNEGGYRAALVGLVADLERFGAGCPEEQALAFARRRAERLPMGYRTEEFHGLFVQFARELVDLRGRAPRDLAAADVESWLDRAEPAWRERLTLRFDGDVARALFAEAMTVQAGGEVDEPLGRQLVRDEDGAWRAFVDVAPATRLPARLMDGIDAAYRRVRLAPTGSDDPWQVCG